jgi:hypothetical protein
MRKDIVELGATPTAETAHQRNTAQTATETTSSPPRQSRGGYERSRFNAVQHAVLSPHTVLPWEDEAEYLSLLRALAEEHTPVGPTEDHLIEEIAGIIWRKQRLRLAEAASYRRGLTKATEPLSETLSTALIQVKHTGPFWPTIDAVTATPSRTAEDLVELKKREASAQSALEILNAGTADAYEAALAELDEPTRRSWRQILAEGVQDLDKDENEDPDADLTPYIADATGLAEYLEQSVLPFCITQLGYLENRPWIRTQVLGEALDLDRLERLSRYEVQLDRKLERMLTMLLRLQGLRRSKESG